jgi:carboxylate-amine ligase
MERGSAANFTRRGTLGIEEEYFVVDETGRPTAGTDALVYGGDPAPVIADRLDHELFKCVVETQTPTLEGPDEAADALAAMRSALVEHAEREGYRIAAAGLHPGARWRELDHAEKERYRAQLDRIQYPQHRNTTAGLHVHVGVDDPEEAVWVANELRWYLPAVLALSANSPFWEGYDTGLASARAKIFEGLPNTGMPSAFDSYEEFDRMERCLLETDSIDDRGEIWWDVRPHSGLGTVEVRVPDAQAAEWRVLALVEYVHALVVDLGQRFRDGESASTFRREHVVENKWRALRYGHDATFVRRDHRGVIDLAEFVEREADRLGVDAIRDLYDAESGASAQRRLAETGTSALYESLIL